MSRILAFLALAASLTIPAQGASRVLELDPEETEVTFTLKATGHTVRGSFALERGRVVLDPSTGRATGEIVVDATTGETGNRRRDAKMHRKVLESDRFPRFVFAPSRVTGEIADGGESELAIEGELVVRGEVHPLTATAEVAIDGERVEAEVRFSIPYVAWGMRDPSVFVLRVAKDVEVTVSARGSWGAGGQEPAAP